MMRLGLAICLGLWGHGAWALDLELPGNASLQAQLSAEPDSYALPTGPFVDGYIPTRDVTGQVTRQAWRIEAQALTTGQIMGPVEVQLRDAGYEIVFTCTGSKCGGFDFRFGTDVMPAPDMFVDLFDYWFLSAVKGPNEAVSVLVSRSGNSAYVQIIHAAPAGTAPKVSATGLVATPGLRADAPVAEQLVAQGHVILGDLAFETGSSALGAGPFASLEALAGFLKANPQARVALVGHTDAVGSLDGNIGLSKKRASSVLERLVGAYGVPRGQLDAEGMGYLSPVAPNTSDEGREANRRVEAVLLNTK